jgi:hypothetical protein
MYRRSHNTKDNTDCYATISRKENCTCHQIRCVKTMNIVSTPIITHRANKSTTDAVTKATCKLPSTRTLNTNTSYRTNEASRTNLNHVNPKLHIYPNA